MSEPLTFVSAYIIVCTCTLTGMGIGVLTAGAFLRNSSSRWYWVFAGTFFIMAVFARPMLMAMVAT